MRLRVSNIGRIGQVDIAIDGITVIAGENNTGKSTMGKALWCMFNSYHELHVQVTEERVSRIARIISRHVAPQVRLSNAFRRLGIEDLLIAFVDNGDSSAVAAWTLIGEVLSLMSERYGDVNVDESEIRDAVDAIVDAMATDDAEILAYSLESRFSNEFNDQAKSFYGNRPGQVGLTIQSEEALVTLHDDGIEIAGKAFDLHAEAVFFDDPFILDETNAVYRRSYPLATRSQWNTTHRTHLAHLLERPFGAGNALESIETSKQLSTIYNKLLQICDGEILASGPNRSRFFFAPRGVSNTIALGNLSSGLKTFVMITMLLSNGAIERNGTIILDEPEIHLHPSWQIQLAELVVLLQKEFGLHVLLTCHSPYFIRAIETYAVKYDIVDVCRYYLSSVDESGIASLTDTSNDREPIYRTLYLPLQDLEDEQAFL